MQLFGKGLVLDPHYGSGTFTQRMVENLKDNKVLVFKHGCAAAATVLHKLNGSQEALVVLKQFQGWRRPALRS